MYDHRRCGLPGIIVCAGPNTRLALESFFEIDTA